MFDSGVFVVLAYEGLPKVRKEMTPSVIKKHNLVVMSYESLRSDVEKLSNIDFLYCVLDEGHEIRNPTTKVTLAAKAVRASHRLILSGTPLQNNVGELWSLFDFLSPGYLGTLREFNATFGKFITASRDPKVKNAVRERATLALESLHRQILPFILRRTKESELKDLPPKIIQDYLCDMSDLQAFLYDDCSMRDSFGQEHHQFKSLQMQQKMCVHPCLIVGESASCSAQRKGNVSGWRTRSWRCATQFTAESWSRWKRCCMSVALVRSRRKREMQVPVAGHRVLLFCQHSFSMDLIQDLLFSRRMRNISFLRLDASVPMTERFQVVSKFNSDPTIDVLMMTVSIGGLGLNLTSADTVIFFEHDWNPQVDAQAMDRAHRLGQKRVVNVYRLITRNTVEEHVMSLQFFKLGMAKAIINEEKLFHVVHGSRSIVGGQRAASC